MRREPAYLKASSADSYSQPNFRSCIRCLYPPNSQPQERGNSQGKLLPRFCIRAQFEQVKGWYRVLDTTQSAATKNVTVLSDQQQFSSSTDWGGSSGEQEGRFSRNPFLNFSARGHCEHPSCNSSVDNSIASPLPLRTNVLKGGFEQDFVRRDMPRRDAVY